jgi:type II secretory ATPase GspE/PulE/Tfp pilus assembly ATPase PilB-like protein
MDYSNRSGLHDEEPAVVCVNTLLHEAIRDAASDIHLESNDTGLRVRYRIDGMLHDRTAISTTLASHVLSRLKVLAHIDITEKRMPQDGQFYVPYQQRRVDVRVATFPAFHGEKIVVRVLDRARVTLSLDQIGMPDEMVHSFRKLVHRSQGFFLVTGPTGSGKTTTLYAALNELNMPERHIITLEDPVEYDLPGVTQGRVNTAIGFTFARGIRALLRQDPDIIMVGEIRDKETAQTAIEAALTGHSVLSTVHTNDAPSVITRLIDMGVDPFLISAAISGVIAQRLVRCICQACRVAYEPSVHEQAQCAALGLSATTLYKGQGCELCQQRGYKGRSGIFQLFIPDDIVREMIMERASIDKIRTYALTKGMKRLQDDGWDKVECGMITLQEFLRVIT